jgi:hypothetical protein
MTCPRSLFGTGKCARNSWFYFTENELSPGVARVSNYKAVFNLRGDDGAPTGGLAVDTNLDWKGREKCVAIVPPRSSISGRGPPGALRSDTSYPRWWNVYVSI